MKKNVCFIHSTYLDFWKDEILESILVYLIESKTIDILEFVFINNIGIALDVKKFESFHSKIIVQNFDMNSDLFELCTIRTLHSFCKINSDYNILYLHTKGVSHSKDSCFIPGIQSWVRFMLYCLVEKHKHCVNILKNYDTVGCNYRPTEVNPAHFSGNFWWATSEHIRTLSVHHLKDKYDAEFWLITKNTKYYNVLTIDYMYETSHSLLDYQFLVDHTLQNRILYCKFGSPGIGLCNQLYSLVNCMVTAKCMEGNTVIIVDDFLTDIDTNIYCPVDDVLDLEKINDFARPNGIVLISKRKCIFQIEKVTFGIFSRNVCDITDAIKQNFFKDNTLHIPSQTNLNSLCSADPVPGVYKELIIEYSINGHLFKRQINESKIQKGLLIDFKDFFNIEWLSATSIQQAKGEKDTFNLFLRNIRFLKKYEDHVTTFLSTIVQTKKVNLIHLRLEKDGIDFWSMINYMSPNEFKKKLELKYIDLIQKYIDRDSITFLLSMNTQNAITDYMKQYNYSYFFMNKHILKGRELNAILDYLLSFHCTGVFIGNVNPYTFHGSTFSYAILNQLKDQKIKKICIDSDHIDDPVYVL